jgi:2-amino-4-hydroxy-6-hydroxymethyldihydropteridine diphosphokinase
LSSPHPPNLDLDPQSTWLTFQGLAPQTTTWPAAIGLGSNLGNSPQILTDALITLTHTHGIQLQAYSHFYQTEPIGPPQPRYYNACALLQVSLSPLELLDQLLEIEQQFGRVRHIRWGPRLLDLDLLLFDRFILNSPTLQIPHPRMQERAFVLMPLVEIAPDWIDPVSQQTIADLSNALDWSGIVRLTKPQI